MAFRVFFSEWENTLFLKQYTTIYINYGQIIKNTNIKSEGLVKGTIQVPADGNPIILLSDHGTIGGYPKFGVVISADYDKLVQIPPGSKIKFKEIELKDAENLYKLYDLSLIHISEPTRLLSIWYSVVCV